MRAAVLEPCKETNSKSSERDRCAAVDGTVKIKGFLFSSSKEAAKIVTKLSERKLVTQGNLPLR